MIELIGEEEIASRIERQTARRVYLRHQGRASVAFKTSRPIARERSNHS